ncbi:MAG: reactive intermediate/imine deaminase [Flavobacteriaceae bacterium]|nr:reactive intermediate/imine deaminase [Flavobacteriaceae bacterium]|tara:strand:+ start:206 stop:586 length:381 start_codon:yes stop_codon:yes gene_type:complete
MKKIISTKEAAEPIGPYNQAVMFGDTLYTSGQIAIDPKNGSLILDTIENETKMVMENLKSILSSAEMSFENVIKCTIFISNMKNFSKINKIYAEYFEEKTAPARETVEVSNLPKYVNIEISLIACK